MNVTVLGTGIMGSGIARSLARGGLSVTAWNRTIARAEPLKKDGVLVEPDLHTALVHAEAVIIALYDADSVLDVLERSASYTPSNTIWIQTATIGVEGTKRVADLAERDGLRVIETMMMGSKDQAAVGHLTLIGGGDPALFEQAKPVLDAMSFKLVHCGPQLGDGTAVKLVCNLWLACITAAASQSIKLLEHQHVDPRLFLEVIDGATTDSPYAHIKGMKAITHDFSPQFEVLALRKDLGLVGSVMESVGFRTDLLSTVTNLYDESISHEQGHEDISVVSQTFDEDSAH
ncbi:MULTISPECIES: NAD(P)-dependent oxidoreductase [Bifidobacterium]|nr:NAD(P)-dependent oxidoreductase [Bifidobacterium tibiigranuli]MCH3974919.1 NAD(P)-dependent oxidoreductase [Bifidobacterium tibiigranuli]MCH4190028.1 NAD(P)-dependent oxidoreductase [Bifidobacterium tibiigranuli]MCH4202679.1 NAD(P)-dependent oxidoreductase [Bifidobacterium tibiigranuli]MCH4273697.1 NAD(P)-dependent oxidoreductase [Bifidobacterium tibiigranuli]MCI1210782.1 NAD(P)-dependent oxidoreductase [Bifidobacterium tibiigranuli]